LDEKGISKAVIKRLPRYYRYLGELIEGGTQRISSGELSELMRVTASQIRQDLNNFGGFGQQGYGYNVQYLYEEIGKILGLDRTHTLIIIGAGKLGQALANYVNFEKRGFKIIGIFDNNEALKGQPIRDLKIQTLDELPSFLEHNKVEIATLTMPKESALEVIDTLVAHSVKGIWNFAHVDLNLRVPSDVIVENVHLSESLMRLSYRLGHAEGK
jgi:AT-rich DNA-binding protein